MQIIQFVIDLVRVKIVYEWILYDHVTYWLSGDLHPRLSASQLLRLEPAVRGVDALPVHR